MYSSSITVDQCIEALAAFLAPFCPGAAVVRAQVNRVAMPPNPCVILTEMATDKLMVPYGKFNDPTQTAAISGSKQIDIQIDFYGPLSGEWCSTAASAMGSEWGYNAFPANIRPLYTTKGLQSPLTTGEQQYESRWTLTASLQYNPVVTVPQQSATVLAVNNLGAVDL